MAENGDVTGIAPDGDQQWQLRQNLDGIYWGERSQATGDQPTTRLSHTATPVGLVFEAHPSMHRFPWRVHPQTMNANVIRQLKKQIKKKARPPEFKLIPKVLQKWKRKRDQDDWIQGQQSQTPLQLLEHDNALTNFQVWVAYRMAAVQLNVFYEGWEGDKSCPLDTGCTTNERNIAHIAWHCVRAQAWWLRILEHWLGNEVTQADLKHYKDYFSARTAPHIGERLKKRILLRLGNWKKEITTNMVAALLWQIRNQVVHEGVKWTAKSQLEFMWRRGLQQLYAVARSERLRANLRIQGLYLQICLESLEEVTVEAPPGKSFR